MAIGPTLIFIAPDWELDMQRSSEPKGTPVPLDQLRSWFRNSGFVQHPGPTNNFTRKPIDLCIHTVGEEVVFVRVEFGVVNDAPDRVDDWQTFVEELCARWGFSLTDSQAEQRVPVAEFRRLLAQDRIWRIASDVNGWPPVWPPQAAAAHAQPAEPILHDSAR